MEIERIYETLEKAVHLREEIGKTRENSDSQLVTRYKEIKDSLSNLSLDEMMNCYDILMQKTSEQLKKEGVEYNSVIKNLQEEYAKQIGELKNELSGLQSRIKILEMEKESVIGKLRGILNCFEKK